MAWAITCIFLSFRVTFLATIETVVTLGVDNFTGSLLISQFWKKIRTCVPCWLEHSPVNDDDRYMSIYRMEVGHQCQAFCALTVGRGGGWPNTSQKTRLSFCPCTIKQIAAAITDPIEDALGIDAVAVAHRTIVATVRFMVGMDWNGHS